MLARLFLRLAMAAVAWMLVACAAPTSAPTPADPSTFSIAPTTTHLQSSTTAPASAPTAAPAKPLNSIAPTASAPTANAQPTAAQVVALAATSAPATATPDTCGGRAHELAIRKFNETYAANGQDLSATLKALGVTFDSFKVVTTGKKFETDGQGRITGIHVFPASNLTWSLPFVLGTPDQVDNAGKTVDIDGSNKLYASGTLVYGGGVLWVSGLNYPELCS